MFQPFVDLSSGQTVGFEALSRFDDGRSPSEWVAVAQRLGARTDLEGALARAAIEAAEHLPRGALVAIKASLALLNQDSKLLDRLRELDRSVVVEMSLPSAAEVSQALTVASSLPPGVGLALDHVGLDHWSLSMVSSLHPALVKLRLDTVVGIASDRARQAEVKAMVEVLRDFGGELLAVGIETSEDHAAIRQLGVRFGQGVLLGRPQEFVEA